MGETTEIDLANEIIAYCDECDKFWLTHEKMSTDEFQKMTEPLWRKVKDVCNYDVPFESLLGMITEFHEIIEESLKEGFWRYSTLKKDEFQDACGFWDVRDRLKAIGAPMLIANAQTLPEASR